jgi:F-type H+-transporting ATPase subunit gamma
VLRKAQEFFRSRQGKKITTIPVGKKGRDSLRRAGFTFAAEYVNVLARVDFRTAREIANLVADLYIKEEIDSVYIIFSEFKSVMVPTLAVEKLLPVESIREDDTDKAGKSDRENKKANETPIDYIYEQPEEQILAKLLPRYVETQILRAMLESSAAEHAARMTAMEAATNNANDVIEALTLHMNKVRQAAITKEIIEIVSGASYGA